MKEGFRAAWLTPSPSAPPPEQLAGVDQLAHGFDIAVEFPVLLSPLRQTATQACAAPVALEGGGSRSWPYAYFEIAQRAPGFDGFLGPQARALFDMTKRSGG